MKEILEKSKKLEEIAQIKKGLRINEHYDFIRYWYEVDFDTINCNSSNLNNNKFKHIKWFPFYKGGEYRKWYKDFEYIAKWGADDVIENLFGIDEKILINQKSIDNICFSLIELYTKKEKKEVIFSNYGFCIFPNHEIDFYYLLSFLNSKVFKKIYKLINNNDMFDFDNFKEIPIIIPDSRKLIKKIDKLTKECINISKLECESRETSRNFYLNELLSLYYEDKQTLESAYDLFSNYWKNNFLKLHKNEEELNKIFIEIYQLQNEITSDIPFEDITILKKETKIIDNNIVFNGKEIIKQLISYAVGCILGRYTLNEPGLHICNLGETYENVIKKIDVITSLFEINYDNIVPILDYDFFKNDIVIRFKEFLKEAFGDENFKKNLKFVESILDKSIKEYFIKEFYKDHIERYKKRPIYWLISSPNKAFQALIYMHRYETDIFTKIQQNYLLKYLNKLNEKRKKLEFSLKNKEGSQDNKKNIKKEIIKIDSLIKEINKFNSERLDYYVKKIHQIDLGNGIKINYEKFIEVNLDDGVLNNYCKFKNILYPIYKLY